MGVNEGFAIAARAQLANISAFTDTMTNVNTTINAANTALQSLSSHRRAGAERRGRDAADVWTAPDKPSRRRMQQAELSSMVGILNTQAGDRYIFSGSAINTPSVASGR